MDSLSKGPFASLVKGMVESEGYRAFVETGTYLGETTLWASTLFERVLTVEIDPSSSERAQARCADHGNIEFFVGRTEERLPQMLGSLSGPAVFWLDAHAGGGWYGEKDDCPLLAELRLIASRGVVDDLVLIDDARGFLAPPPPPFDPDAWPPIHAVLETIDPRHERYIVIVKDVIICAPPRLQSRIIEFCNVARPKI